MEKPVVPTGKLLLVLSLSTHTFSCPSHSQRQIRGFPLHNGFLLLCFSFKPSLTLPTDIIKTLRNHQWEERKFYILTRCGNQWKGRFKESWLSMGKISHSSKDSPISSHFNYHCPFLSGTIELSSGEIGQEWTMETDTLQSQTKQRVISASSNSPSNSKGSWK